MVFQYPATNHLLKGYSILQDVPDELQVQAIVLEVVFLRGLGDMIELLAPIDIGKGAIEKVQAKAYANAG